MQNTEDQNVFLNIREIFGVSVHHQVHQVQTINYFTNIKLDNKAFNIDFKRQ